MTLATIKIPTVQRPLYLSEPPLVMVGTRLPPLPHRNRKRLSQLYFWVKRKSIAPLLFFLQTSVATTNSSAQLMLFRLAWWPDKILRLDSWAHRVSKNAPE